MSLRETLMPNGFRSIPSTEQRLEGVERKIDQVVAKLDMILDSMTKPTQEEKAKAFIDRWADNAPSFNPARPAALDVDDEYCSMKMPKSTHEPKRLSGKPAKVQIEDWIRRNFKTLVYFKKAAQFGLVVANVEKRSAKANSTHRYTHRIKFSGSFPESFNPTVFGQRELDEVIAYLESLGVNVNTNALNRV